MSHRLERHARHTSEPLVLVSTFEDVTQFTAGTALR
jgi:hypothetical protein